MSVTLRTLEGPAADAYLASSWAELYDQAPEASPYQLPSWPTGWAGQLPPTDRPVTALCEETAGRVLAALPLVHDREGGRVRTYALSTPMGEYARPVGPTAHDPQVVASFARYLHDLAREGHDVEVSGLPAQGDLARHLTPAVPVSVGGRRTEVADCAEIPLPVAYEAMSLDPARSQTTPARLGEARSHPHCGLPPHPRQRRVARRLRGPDPPARPPLGRSHPPDTLTHAPDAPHWPAVLKHCGPNTAFVATLTLTLDTRTVAAQRGRGRVGGPSSRGGRGGSRPARPGRIFTLMASANGTGPTRSGGRLDHSAMPSITLPVIVEIVALDTLAP